MPRITHTAIDRQTDALNTTGNFMPEIVNSSTTPMVITAVQRKANIGNYETIDLYAAVALPIGSNSTDFDEIKALLEQAIEQGFALTSTETGDRYRKIKESLK